ncbi:uncharacterized protein LOC114349816 isoform X2 [Ostrinia furnacalis]|uniref:uncharacterized protein LOC114349816 isoform X2 n=1 Tax=Ostrinia furnacalis TaxID=93504 RepID=UPI00103BB225|nr:uncharacterized protein LOC114349816 isoform X2 [Ostrinia furnacalis]
MMSQQRSRKAAGAALEAPRGRQSVVKASGDSVSSNLQAKQPTVRSTSKSKIPKSLRYDLENALVGLCDVWFEEIKPHLVRNNIKVHVHGGGPASGDHRRLPPGAPGCSHLDPGAAPDPYQRACVSCADCSSTRPTASRARCRRPPPSGRPPVSSPAQLRASLLNPYQTYEAKLPKSKTRRTPRPQPPPPTWRTPRLCRTYSIITPRSKPPERRSHTADPRKHRHNQPKRRPKKIFVDKSTQTPALRRPEILPTWQEEPPSVAPVCDLFGQEPRHKATTPSCLRCPATTTLHTQRARKHLAPASPLFQDDLINIIAEKNDKQLRVLFRSPTRSDHTSTLNLVQTQPARPMGASKKVPWR